MKTLGVSGSRFYRLQNSDKDLEVNLSLDDIVYTHSKCISSTKEVDEFYKTHSQDFFSHRFAVLENEFYEALEIYQSSIRLL